jgi:hypothetical protein
MQGNGYESVEQQAGAWSQVQRAAAPAPLDAPGWLVYVEGSPVVGPVSASQVAHGIRSGRVPADASIQAIGEVFWTGVLDEPAVVAALKSV